MWCSTATSSCPVTVIFWVDSSLSFWPVINYDFFDTRFTRVRGVSPCHWSLDDIVEIQAVPGQRQGMDGTGSTTCEGEAWARLAGFPQSSLHVGAPRLQQALVGVIDYAAATVRLRSYMETSTSTSTSTVTVTVTVTVTDSLLQQELQKSLHPSPVVSRLLRRPVQSSPTWSPMIYVFKWCI